MRFFISCIFFDFEVIQIVLDKGVRIVKSSTLAQITGRSTPARSLSVEEPEWDIDLIERLSWGDGAVVRDG